MDDSVAQQVLNFCRIQMALIDEKEHRLRKELLDCEIQREFLAQILGELRTPADGGVA